MFSSNNLLIVSVVLAKFYQRNTQYRQINKIEFVQNSTKNNYNIPVKKEIY